MKVESIWEISVSYSQFYYKFKAFYKKFQSFENFSGKQNRRRRSIFVACRNTIPTHSSSNPLIFKNFSLGFLGKVKCLYFMLYSSLYLPGAFQYSLSFSPVPLLLFLQCFLITPRAINQIISLFCFKTVNDFF